MKQKHVSAVRHVLLPLLICALLCGGIPTALILTGHKEPLRAAVNTVVTPIASLFSYVGGRVGAFTDYFTEFDALKEENERLRSQLASMEDKVRSAEAALQENAFLSEFLGLKEDHTDYHFLKCEVVAAEQSGYRMSLTLNAGAEDGVTAGCPVMGEAGVVGRVTETGAGWSRVEPLISVSSAVGAYVERSGTGGVVKGDYTCFDAGNLLFTYPDGEADLEVGDRIRTSGVNSYYPRGLLIGEVTAVLRDPATMMLTAVVTPAESASRIRDAMILTDFAVPE